jgi:hypothetical protein
MTDRCFPPPWSVEDTGAAFVVKDGSGQKLLYVSRLFVAASYFCVWWLLRCFGAYMCMLRWWGATGRPYPPFAPTPI